MKVKNLARTAKNAVRTGHPLGLNHRGSNRGAPAGEVGSPEFEILEGVMGGNHRREKDRDLRVELKYCEHCGGLWVREAGAGVFCERCQPIVADLPIPKKKPGQAKLPVAPPTVVGEYETEVRDEDAPDLEAVGGAA
jgi:hypothetical protein